MKERNIKILEYQGDGGLPKGKNLFYLCLNCHTIIPSMKSGSCHCGNILIDADEGSGGFKDISQTLVLELE